ncbi:MAG TPA: ribonuclease P protein component [Phycisphaerales bacterium]|nr:ribonuclease P protein component [Phycisphaerales bacterium]
MTLTGDPSPSRRFGPSQRLSHDVEFEAVYQTKVRKIRPPFSMSSKPNGLGRYRLGLAIPKKVGSAPRRNRFKRLIREAFRLEQGGFAGLPGSGYDIVVGIRAHELPPGDPGLAYVRGVLVELATLTHTAWEKRGRSVPPGSAP